jgi:hypothetical protein
MYWHKHRERKLGGYWQCREARKSKDAATWRGYYYERMPAEIRIRKALDTRRECALRRRRERQPMEA